MIANFYLRSTPRLGVSVTEALYFSRQPSDKLGGRLWMGRSSLSAASLVTRKTSEATIPPLARISPRRKRTTYCSARHVPRGPQALWTRFARRLNGYLDFTFAEYAAEVKQLAVSRRVGGRASALIRREFESVHMESFNRKEAKWSSKLQKEAPTWGAWTNCVDLARCL